MSTQVNVPTVGALLRDLTESDFEAKYACDRFTATVLSNRYAYIVEHLAGALLRTAFSPIPSRLV